MSLESIRFNLRAAISDCKRDKAIPLPRNVTCCCNISYGSQDGTNLLDVYYPDGAISPLPTIVSIHGGGYVYGSKEVYRRYGMDLARRGFAVINFNYRLAPKWRFPTPLEDTNSVLEWVCQNANRYHLDPSRILLVGDSAGAQLASQYAAIATNKTYAALFSFRTPAVTLRALGLNCGIYDLQKRALAARKGLFLDYFSRELDPQDPRLQVLSAITPAYPPAYLATAYHDFLREEAQPMYDFLTALGIPAVIKCYGSQEKKAVGHVFHVNLALPEATACNDAECAFFRKYIE